MAHLPGARFTFADYVSLEEMANVKHEYLAGQVWAMAGGSPEHAGIAASILGLIRNALRGRPCRAFSADLRIRVQATGLGTYPDAAVICGELELDPEDARRHTVLNPTVLVEVLSPSTEDYDRGDKLGQYKLIPSVREVMLVAHDRREIEIVRRESDGSWSRHVAGEGESARLASIGCELPVAEVYEDPLRK
jgi:Uma2 family endonuclease